MNDRKAKAFDRRMNEKAHRIKYDLPFKSGYFARVALLLRNPPTMAPTSIATSAVPTRRMPKPIQSAMPGIPPAYADEGVNANKAPISRASEAGLCVSLSISTFFLKPNVYKSLGDCKESSAFSLLESFSISISFSVLPPC